MAITTNSVPPSVADLRAQAEALRQTILAKMARDGGHVSSPLGVIELIQALIQVFDFPRDKILFDTGHQMHAYKLLTDRAAAFDSMDKQGGIGEYANIHESPYDFYTGGHCGTAISAALGYSIHHPEYKSIAIIGDGAMTGGQPFEALNQAGQLRTNLLVIYNDNEYAVTGNTGFLHSCKKLRALSESLGFEYIGPIDGHDTSRLIRTLRTVQAKTYPVFLHVKTVKGKDYAPAEQNPVAFHYPGPFDLATGRFVYTPGNEFSELFVQAAHTLKRQYDNLYFVTPAAGHHAGLETLERRYPGHVYDTGISEQHCITFAAGLALSGNKVICLLPATFLPRAFDQIIDVCLLKVPMVFVLLKPGIAATGPTHQGVYTFPLLNGLPHARLYSPANGTDFSQLLGQALEHAGPTFIQKPVEAIAGLDDFAADPALVEVQDGDRLTVLCLGNMLERAQMLARNIAGVQILYARQLVPFNLSTLQELLGASEKLLILEDGLVPSGIGQAIAAQLSQTTSITCDVLGVRDRFPQLGTLQEVYEAIGLGDNALLHAAQRVLHRQNFDPQFAPHRHRLNLQTIGLHPLAYRFE